MKNTKHEIYSTWTRPSLIFLLQFFFSKKLKYLNQKCIKDSICSGICSETQTVMAQNNGGKKKFLKYQA